MSPTQFKSETVKTFIESLLSQITEDKPTPEIRVVWFVPDPRIVKLTFRLTVMVFDMTQLPG
jgi:hypothetical protein